MNQIGMIKPTILYGFGADAEVTGDGTNGTTDGSTYDDGMMQIALDYNNGAGMNAQFAYLLTPMLIQHLQLVLLMMVLSLLVLLMLQV